MLQQEKDDKMCTDAGVQITYDLLRHSDVLLQNAVAVMIGPSALSWQLPDDTNHIVISIGPGKSLAHAGHAATL